MNSDLNVIFEDADILVIDKPSGLIVNNSQTSGELTVQNLLAPIDTSLLDEGEESEYFDRSGIVHRLDKDTSGILLIAKNEPAFKRLQKQFKK